MKTSHVLFAGIAAIAFFVAGTWLRLGEHGTKVQDDLSRLGAIELTDYTGAPISLETFSGKPLIVNSWAVWCPFCKKELPDFATLQREFPDIVVIAIDRNEPPDQVKGYTDELGISADMTFLLDTDDAFYRSIGGFSMPETLFIDKTGSIVFHKRGPLTLDEMRSAVRQYLNKL